MQPSRVVRTGSTAPADGASAGSRPKHMPQLDGLRTVAVVLVLGYHIARTEDLSVLPGGFVGVDVFFVLSGFLITTLLLREHRSTGTVDLRRFYARRLWRLYPALLLVCLVVAAAFALAPGVFGLEGGSLLEPLVALFYGMSWWGGLELPGGPYLLGLTWSLSVEEHFYLLWPVLLLAVLRRGGGVRAITAVAVLANAWPAVLWQLGADPDRLYYLPDTRFAQLLTGCALAALLASPHADRLRPVLSARLAATCAAGIALVALLGSRYDGWYWSVGMQLVGVAAAVVVGHLVLHGQGRMSQLLQRGPLPVLGVWSYGIYLWHLPLIRLAQPVLGETLLVATVAALLSIPVAAASYRFVEQPVLRSRAERRTPVTAPTAPGRATGDLDRAAA